MSFFRRDSQTKSAYLSFGDLFKFDKIYRTYCYEMICAPFVFMNNYAKNVMVGCGFLMNKKVDSFGWLFEIF